MDREFRSQLRRRAAAVRQQALELVEELSRPSVARDPAGSEALVRLVSAANQLGLAEAMLDPDARSRASRAAERPRLSQDAAIVLALAETSVPFAATREDEAERWVRILRLHGQVGAAMQGLGVPEAPLESPAQEPATVAERRAERIVDAAGLVGDRAADLARRRAADTITTVDVLFGVIEVYGGAFERALYMRGTTRDEVIARLATVVTTLA